ncbi:MAG: polysaccharide deacetylase family protein [Dethiobacter sp.]|nr:polysaccharide deacetylase family protein [Dethiobacter sp.]
MSREERRRKRKLKICIFLAVTLLSLAILLHNQILSDVFSPSTKGALYRVRTSQNVVALTFDAVWEPAETGRILDVLDRYQVRATFFLTGNWVRYNPDLAREILIRGHEIGQHSQNHQVLTGLKDEELAREFRLMEETLREELNCQAFLFRPPYGEVNQQVYNYANDRGYTTVLWSIDPHDWLNPGVDQIVSRVIKNLHKGAIIMFHTSSTQAVDALPLIIQGLRMKDYSILTVSQLLELAEMN